MSFFPKPFFSLFSLTFIKFILVGVINTLVGTSVMFLLYNWCGCSYWFSSISNYLVGGIVSFFLNKYFTFQSKECSWKQIVTFVLTLAICYLLSYSLSKFLSECLLKVLNPSLRGNIALLGGAVLYVFLNYLGQKYLVFSQNSKLRHYYAVRKQSS